MRVKIGDTIYCAESISCNQNTLIISIPRYHYMIIVDVETCGQASAIFQQILESGYCDADKYHRVVQMI